MKTQKVGLLCGQPVVVYQADHGDGMGHTCEPRITRLPSGELLLAHRLGSSRMSSDGVVQLLRSRDGGRSWTVVGQPFSKTAEGRIGDHLLAAVGGTSSGRLVAMVAWMDRSNPEKLWRNRETEGRLPLKMLCSASEDGGVAWTALQEVGVAPLHQAVPQVIYCLSSDELVCTFETFKEYDDPGPWDYRAGLVISGDDGVSWSGPFVAAEVGTDGAMWWDPRIAQLADGRLVQFYHALHYPSGTDLPVHVGWSEDSGRSWSRPVSTGLLGQHTWPVALEDGRLLAVVQRRSDPKGLLAFLSDDGGRSFDPDTEIWVYRHGGVSAGPADGSMPSVQYFDDMDAFTFGHPTGTALPDGSAVVCYFAGERDRTAIYAVHLYPDATGGKQDSVKERR